MPVNCVKVPGKVMLFGEYAVLVGGSAVMYPVPRHLVLTERKNTPHVPYTPVVEIARTIAIPELAIFETEYGGVNLDCDSSRFFVHDKGGVPCKLGLGLSAAEAVGVIALRFQRAGYNVENLRDKIAEYALRAHSLAQNGRGSGADVYCCAYETPLKYNLENGHSRMKRLYLNHTDAGLPMHLVYTGNPSDSRKAVDTFNNWYQNMAAADRHQLHRLIQVSETLAAAWVERPGLNALNDLDIFIMIMKSISDKAGLHYWNDVHTDLDTWARKYGGRAKPAGAGGGDMALILGHVPIDEIWPQQYDFCLEIIPGLPGNSDKKTAFKTR